MATSLPAEITDAIIDCAYDDRLTLHFCSLTCRSWRVRAQYHLFAVITLEDLQPIEHLSAGLTTAPHLAAHIRHVKLSTDPNDWNSFLSLGPLPHVKELTLAVPGGIGFEWGLDNDCVQRLGTSFPHTRSVSFIFTPFSDFSDLLNFLQTFPRIVDVRLRESVVVNSHRLLEPVIGMPFLLSLALDEFWCMHGCWLDPHVYPLLRGLRRLCIYSGSQLSVDDSAEATGMLAGRVSRTLEELEISVLGIEDAISIICRYCATKLPIPALRHLRLSIVLPHYASNEHPAVLLDRDSIDGDLAMLLCHMRDICLDSRVRVDVELTVKVRRLRQEYLRWKIVKGLLARAPLPWHCTITAPGLLYNSAHDGAAPAEG